jgi:hypothetical protein
MLLFKRNQAGADIGGNGLQRRQRWKGCWPFRFHLA